MASRTALEPTPPPEEKLNKDSGKKENASTGFELEVHKINGSYNNNSLVES